jgi:hypothetical protein
MSSFENKKELIDALLHRIRLEGFQIVSRKAGKYLPAPAPVGGYEIDALAKRSGVYCIGLALDAQDLVHGALAAKIEYLATRTSKISKKPVTLYIGVDQAHYVKLAQLLQTLGTDVRNQIRTYPMTATPEPDLFLNMHKAEPQPRNYFN